MISNNDMTMRLTMANLAAAIAIAAKGNRNQCTTSLTVESFLQKNITHTKESRSTKHTTPFTFHYQETNFH